VPLQDAYKFTDDSRPPDDFLDTLVDIREYDVPYVVRVAIDMDLRVGAWYRVAAEGDSVGLEWQRDMVDKVGAGEWKRGPAEGASRGVRPPSFV
jgi:DNA polymerase elongation subunit (family B)